MPSAACSAAAAMASSALAAQRVLRGGGAQRRGAHVGQRDAHVLDRAVARLLDHRADADHGPVLGAAGELQVARAPAVEARHPDLGDDLALADRGREVVLEHVGRRDLAGAAGAGHRERALAGQEHGGQVGGRVAVGQRAADGPAVAHLLVGDRAPSPGPPGRARRCPAGRRDASSRRSATGRSRAARRAGPATLRRSTSSVGAASRSFISGSSECPPASSLASSPPSLSAGQRLVERLGCDVVELGRDHWDPPFASLMAAQTRMGVSGMSM